MKKLVNQVRLIGNLGKDVQSFDLDGDKKLAKATLATNQFYFNKAGEKIEDTTWHNLVAWGKTAEWFIKMGQKGAKVLVEGKISNRSFEDKNGQTKYISEIIIEDFMILKSSQAAPF